MVLQQNARRTAASLLPPLTHLPPSMVIPGKSTVQAVSSGKAQGEAVQDQKVGEE
jgi:chorismate synthase